MKKENLTIGCFYNDYINFYDLENGEMVLTVEEIFYKEVLKTLFDDEVFYDGLMNLLDGMGVEEIGVEKNEDGKFTFYVSSYLINKDYRLSEVEENTEMRSIFTELYEYLLNRLIEQSNIQMVAVIEGIGDMIDTMKKDNINERTIYLHPRRSREDNLTWLALGIVNDTETKKTETEKQIVKNFHEVKNKYNFKEIIFDEDEYQVTFKF